MSAVETLAAFSDSSNVKLSWLKGAAACCTGVCKTTCGPVRSIAKLPLKARLSNPCRSRKAAPASVYWYVPSVLGTSTVNFTVLPSSSSAPVTVAPGVEKTKSVACTLSARICSLKVTKITLGAEASGWALKGATDETYGTWRFVAVLPLMLN